MTGAVSKPVDPGIGLGTREILQGLAVVLVVLGLSGASHPAVGYGFFMVASLLLLAGAMALACFTLTRWFDTGTLRRTYRGAFWLGAWCYVFALASMSGYFIHETWAGRMEWRYIIFGPAALAAIVVFDAGIWRVLVKRNQPTLRRFGDLWRRETLDPGAMRRVLIDEVLLHRTLLSTSGFRWVRHQLMFWGFAVMFALEGVAVTLREALPAFGWTRLWYQPDHPLRLALDFGFDLSGLMIAIGCILALVFRYRVRASELKKFTDTPTALFLLLVVATGFAAEGARLALAQGTPGAALSFVGYTVAAVVAPSSAWHDTLWTVHGLLACGFIAYVPLKRMIHSCATPLGRLLNSQISVLAAKKMRSISGLLRGQKASQG